MNIRLIIMIAGKMDAPSRPVWMLFSADFVHNPTSDGPKVPPASPARASSAKRAVPPPGILAEVRLIAPGHIIATARPLAIQPVKATIGMEEREAVRYAAKHRIPAHSM